MSQGVHRQNKPIRVVTLLDDLQQVLQLNQTKQPNNPDLVANSDGHISASKCM